MRRYWRYIDMVMLIAICCINLYFNNFAVSIINFILYNIASNLLEYIVKGAE